MAINQLWYWAGTVAWRSIRHIWRQSFEMSFIAIVLSSFAKELVNFLFIIFCVERFAIGFEAPTDDFWLVWEYPTDKALKKWRVGEDVHYETFNYSKSGAYV